MGKVELRPYLTQLCQSLAASMIADPDRLTIAVKVDDTAVVSDVRVSLGLTVTELVINALKHAFADQPKGTINIDYHASGDDWTLSVAEDGTGTPAGIDAPKAGPGAGIVEALEKNPAGEIMVRAAEPGTVVTIRHWRSADLGRSRSPAA